MIKPVSCSVGFRAQPSTTVLKETAEYIHLLFSSLCFCLMHYIYSGVWPYLNIPYSHTKYLQLWSFLFEDPNIAHCLHSDQEEMKLLLLSLNFLDMANKQLSLKVTINYSRDLLLTGAEGQNLAYSSPSIPFEAFLYSAILIMILPRQMLISCSSWFTKFLFLSNIPVGTKRVLIHLWRFVCIAIIRIVPAVWLLAY